MKIGKFITFEGADGVGKSTQLALTAEFLREQGVELLLTREPGGTVLAEKLRNLVKTPIQGEEIYPLTELLVIEAARVQHVENVIRPALKRGCWVLCDRFGDSTLAYQGYGRGLDVEFIKDLNLRARNGAKPDLTVLLTVSESENRHRLQCRTGVDSSATDRFDGEKNDFKARVESGFRAIATENPDRVSIVDASGTPEETQQKIRNILKLFIPEGIVRNNE